MMDFTLKTYRKLIETLRANGYVFQTLEQFVEKPGKRVVIIRHDVDILNRKALPFARLEKEINIPASYYFRYLKKGFDPVVIREIASLGHEVGYHYEDLTANNGDLARAIESFAEKLKKIKELYPVKTICMHGRSGSPHNNRDLWNTYNYRDYGIICEPYLDLDYDKVLYLTDTTQRWNDSKIALRDRVESKYEFSFTTTYDIINSVKSLPNQILFTIHPELWSDNILGWLGAKVFVFIHSNYKFYFRNKRVQRDS